MAKCKNRDLISNNLKFAVKSSPLIDMIEVIEVGCPNAQLVQTTV